MEWISCCRFLNNTLHFNLDYSIVGIFQGYFQVIRYLKSIFVRIYLFAGSLESANSSILAVRRHFKEVVGKKIRILL